MTVQRVTTGKGRWKSATSRGTTRAESERHALEASAYYRRVRARLYKDPHYCNKFVAIRDKKVVDVDADKFALNRRLLLRFPDHRFYCMPVWSKFPEVSIDSY